MTKSFGAILQQHRKRAGMTLEALAQDVNSTKSYIWELENKPNIRPSAELVYRLAKTLGTTVGVLMGQEDPGEGFPQDLPEQDRVFFRDYQELRPQTKQRLKNIMDILSQDESE